MEPVLDFRNTNTLWGSVLVETLVRLGVRKAVVSPGSRSTPLAVALAAHPGVEAISILDERSAAFLRLGRPSVRTFRFFLYALPEPPAPITCPP